MIIEFCCEAFLEPTLEEEVIGTDNRTIIGLTVQLKPEEMEDATPFTL